MIPESFMNIRRMEEQLPFNYTNTFSFQILNFIDHVSKIVSKTFKTITGNRQNNTYTFQEKT